MRDEVCSMSYVTMLPMELHFRIHYHVLTDMDTNFDDYKVLRLVCQLFNLVWSPVVLAHLVFFPSARHENIQAQLLYLERNSSNDFSFAKTLTIQHWHNLNIGVYGFVEDVRSAQLLSNLDPQTASTLMGALFTIVSLVKLARLLKSPKEIPRRLKAASELHQARRFASKFSDQLSFPNVHCAKLIFRALEGKWVVQHTMKILRALPQLTELELFLPGYSDMPYIVRCLASICTLRRFSVETKRDMRFFPAKYRENLTQLHHFRAVIAHNPNLTHLTLLSNIPCNFFILFCDIPADRPLKLERLSLGLPFSEFKAIIPHIRSLKSFNYQEFYYNPGNMWASLSKEDIFPPIIQTSRIDSDVITYFERHPGIVSLSHGEVRPGICDLFYHVLAQHSRTLQSLASRSRYLAASLNNISNETNLLQCTNIREFVLHASYEDCEWNCCQGQKTDGEVDVFPVIGRLSRELIVVIANNKQFFAKCVAYCDVSDNPLVRDLKGRIVYERRIPISLFS